MTYFRCPICNTAFQACGPDHMTLPPVDLPPEGTTMAEPQKLREYTYLVGRVPITAMLTEDQAKRMNAELVEQAEKKNQDEDVPEHPHEDVPDKVRRARKR